MNPISRNATVADDSEPPYKVGYKKPPKEHQFRPGESGRNRKRKQADSAESSNSAALFASLRKALAKKISVTVRGKSRKKTLLEILVDKYIQSALGDPRLLGNLLKLVEKADIAELESRSGEPMTIKIIGGLPDTDPPPDDLPETAD
jgi:hypothetical protein